MRILVGVVMMLSMCLHDSWAQTYTGHTTDGHACVFPFIYKTVSYSNCTTVQNNGIAWCATETDANNNYITDKWGKCGMYSLITVRIYFRQQLSQTKSDN